MNDKLVKIASFSSDFEAEIAKGKLKSSGIESFIFKDECGGMHPHLLLTRGVQLKVRDQDSEEAKYILQSKVDDEIQIPSTDEETFKRVQQLLTRARGWLLVGFAIIPGFISFPISYIYATKALRVIRLNNLDDVNLRKKLIRISFVSVLFSLLSWTISFIYLSEHLTSR